MAVSSMPADCLDMIGVAVAKRSKAENKDLRLWVQSPCQQFFNPGLQKKSTWYPQLG